MNLTNFERIRRIVMQKRVKKIQELFKTRFGVPLDEKDLYGNIVPRLHKQMDDFLYKEISDTETVLLADYLSEKLHGKSLLKEAVSSNNIKDLEEPQTKPSTVKKKSKKE